MASEIASAEVQGICSRSPVDTCRRLLFAGCSLGKCISFCQLIKPVLVSSLGTLFCQGPVWLKKSFEHEYPFEKRSFEDEHSKCWCFGTWKREEGRRSGLDFTVFVGPSLPERTIFVFIVFDFFFRSPCTAIVKMIDDRNMTGSSFARKSSPAGRIYFFPKLRLGVKSYSDMKLRLRSGASKTSVPKLLPRNEETRGG